MFRRLFSIFSRYFSVWTFFLDFSPYSGSPIHFCCGITPKIHFRLKKALVLLYSSILVVIPVFRRIFSFFLLCETHISPNFGGIRYFEYFFDIFSSKLQIYRYKSETMWYWMSQPIVSHNKQLVSKHRTVKRRIVFTASLVQHDARLFIMSTVAFSI